MPILASSKNTWREEPYPVAPYKPEYFLKTALKCFKQQNKFIIPQPSTVGYKPTMDKFYHLLSYFKDGTTWIKPSIVKNAKKREIAFSYNNIKMLEIFVE